MHLCILFFYAVAQFSINAIYCIPYCNLVSIHLVWPIQVQCWKLMLWYHTVMYLSTPCPGHTTSENSYCSLSMEQVVTYLDSTEQCDLKFYCYGHIYIGIYIYISNCMQLHINIQYSCGSVTYKWKQIITFCNHTISYWIDNKHRHTSYTGEYP